MQCQKPDTRFHPFGMRKLEWFTSNSNLKFDSSLTYVHHGGGGIESHKVIHS